MLRTGRARGGGPRGADAGELAHTDPGGSGTRWGWASGEPLRVSELLLHMGFSRGPPLVLFSARSLTESQTMRTMAGACSAKPLGNPDAADATGCAGIWACTSPDAPSSQRASKTRAVITVSKTGRWDAKDEGEALLRASQLHQVGLGLELGLTSSRAALQTWRGSCQNGRLLPFNSPALE